MNTLESSDELIRKISATFGWGPINSGAAVQADFRCEYCLKELLGTFDAYYSWEIDHIVPGDGDTLENCALSCRTCNHLKHNYVPIGASRAELVADAKRRIEIKRKRKYIELQKLRGILGLPEINAV